MKDLDEVDQLTTDELFYILECDSLDRLKEEKDGRYRHLIDQMDTLYLGDHRAKTLSVYSAIDISSRPISSWWGVLSLVNIGLIMVPLTITIGVATLALGIAYFYFNWQKLHREAEKMTASFHLTDLKLAAADKLIEKQEAELKAELGDAYIARTLKPVEYVIKPALESPSKIASLGVAVTTSSTLFVSYFWGVASILKLMGFLSAATVMTGPIGVAVAGVAAVGLGLYFGYKHFQAESNRQAVLALKEGLDESLNLLKYRCAELKGQLKMLPLVKLRQSKGREMEVEEKHIIVAAEKDHDTPLQVISMAPRQDCVIDRNDHLCEELVRVSMGGNEVWEKGRPQVAPTTNRQLP